MIQNEPNFPGRAGEIPSVPLFYRSTIQVRCRLCETKPIPGRVGWEGVWRTRDDCAKQTQSGGAKCAKRSQSGGRSRKGKCLVGKELWWIGQPKGFGETKPIWRTNRTKQTQFPPLCRSGDRRSQGANRAKQPNFGESAGRRNTQHSTILLFHHSSPMPIVQNEPNSRRRRRGAGPEGRGTGPEGRES